MKVRGGTRCLVVVPPACTSLQWYRRLFSDGSTLVTSRNRRLRVHVDPETDLLCRYFPVVGASHVCRPWVCIWLSLYRGSANAECSIRRVATAAAAPTNSTLFWSLAAGVNYITSAVCVRVDLSLVLPVHHVHQGLDGRCRRAGAPTWFFAGNYQHDVDRPL